MARNNAAKPADQDEEVAVVHVVKGISRTSAVRGHRRSIGVHTRLHKGPVEKISMHTQTRRRGGRSRKQAASNSLAASLALIHNHPNITIRKPRNQSASPPTRKKPANRNASRTDSMATQTADGVEVQDRVGEVETEALVVVLERIEEQEETDYSVNFNNVIDDRSINQSHEESQPGTSSVLITTSNVNNPVAQSSQLSATASASIPPYQTRNSQNSTRIICDNCGSVVRSSTMTTSYGSIRTNENGEHEIWD